MTIPPMDMSPLEPPDGEAHWERLAARIEAGAAMELARRARGKTWWDLLAERAVPVLAAAAAVIVLAGAQLLWQPLAATDPATEAIAALSGLSYESAEAVVADRTPSLIGLLVNPEGR